MGYMLTGCSSKKALALAIDAQAKVETQNARVLQILIDLEKQFQNLKVREGKQWDAWIMTLKTQHHDLEQLVTALDQDEPPEYLDRVSSSTNQNYRRILKGRTYINNLETTINSRLNDLESIKRLADSSYAATKESSDAGILKGTFNQLKPLYEEARKAYSKTTPNIDDPDWADPDSIKAQSKAITDRINIWVNNYQYYKRNNKDRQISLDNDISQITKEKDKISIEIENILTRKKTFENEIKQILIESKTLRKEYSKSAQVTNQATQKVKEAIEQNVKLEKVAGAVISAAVKITTGLNLNNIISSEDAQRVTSLLNTANYVLDTTTTKAEKAEKEAKKELS